MEKVKCGCQMATSLLVNFTVTNLVKATYTRFKKTANIHYIKSSMIIKTTLSIKNSYKNKSHYLRNSLVRASQKQNEVVRKPKILIT